MVIRRIGLGLIALVAAGYIAAAAYMGINQRSFLFRVEPSVPVLANAGLERAKETALVAADGVRLVGWQIEPQTADAPVIVYFHGNAGNLMRRAERFRLLTSGGAGLIAFHYRGYGGSGGEPGEGALAADSLQIFQDASQRFPGRKLLLFGESLGSGVATQLAARVQAAALILDSPFLSVLDRASATYPWLPVKWLLNHHFRSDLAIGSVRMPILILHGDRDQVIPIEDGERLFALAPTPKHFARFAGAGHVGAFRFGAMDHIRRYLKEAAGLDL